MKAMHLGLAFLGGAQLPAGVLAGGGRDGGELLADLPFGARACRRRVDSKAAVAHHKAIGAAMASGPTLSRRTAGGRTAPERYWCVAGRARRSSGRDPRPN